MRGRQIEQVFIHIFFLGRGGGGVGGERNVDAYKGCMHAPAIEILGIFKNKKCPVQL